MVQTQAGVRVAGMTGASRSELGDFLRSRREGLSPQAVGLSPGRRRRTPGLRREEVAELAGIGVDWYIRLEQGRDVSPSATTVDALAAALCLSPAEHAHLRVLAAPPARRIFSREEVPEAIRRLVEGLPQPAYVTGRRLDLLAWNGAAECLFGFGHPDEAERNILLYMFLESRARRLFGKTWAQEAGRMVAQFRTTFDVWAGDPAFVHLVGRLQEGSVEFAALWDTHDVRAPSAGEKCLEHPEQGPRCYEYVTFQANDNPALRLSICTSVEQGPEPECAPGSLA